jgi:hypothetical protein
LKINKRGTITAHDSVVALRGFTIAVAIQVSVPISFVVVTVVVSVGRALVVVSI